MSTRTTASSSFLEKPADPPGMPGKPDMALASMGIYVFNTKFLFEQLRRDAADPNPAAISARTSFPTSSSTARRWRTASTQSCVPLASRERRSLLARRRHDRRLLGGQYRSDRRRARRSISTTATGRSGPMARSRRRPSSSTTRTAGAARRSLAGLRRLHRVRRRAARSRCCSPACTCIPIPASRAR